MQTRRERLFVRAASLGVVAGSIALAAFMHTPAVLPGTALGSGVLLFFERTAVVLVALLFLLVAVYRGWRGDLPSGLSGRGAEWEPIAEQNDALQAQITELRVRLDTLEARSRLERRGLR